MKKLLLFLMSLMLVMTGCTKSDNTITFSDAKKMLDKNSMVVLVDVRSPEEFNKGHLNGAINVPVKNISFINENYEKDDEIVVYCKTGARASNAVDGLNKFGFKYVYNAGGLSDYNDEFGELVIRWCN